MLFVLFRSSIVRFAQFGVTLQQKGEHFFGRGKTTVSGQENVDVGGF